MKILQEKEKNREDSFWYEGEIAKLGRFILIANGDIRVKLFGETFFRKDADVVNEALSRNYFDKDLCNFEWGNNNWFEVITDAGESFLCDVRDTYDEGIAMLKEYYNESAREEIIYG